MKFDELITKSEEEKAFDTLLDTRIKARKNHNNEVLLETEDAFKKATSNYIKSVKAKYIKENVVAKSGKN